MTLFSLFASKYICPPLSPYPRALNNFALSRLLADIIYTHHEIGIKNERLFRAARTQNGLNLNHAAARGWWYGRSPMTPARLGGWIPKTSSIHQHLPLGVTWLEAPTLLTFAFWASNGPGWSRYSSSSGGLLPFV